MLDLTKKERLDLQTQELKHQRLSYEAQWRDIASFLLPYRLRLQLSDQARGDRRNLQIYESTAIQTLNALEGGMTAMISSSAIPWIRRVLKGDPEYSEFGPVKEWLDFVTQDQLAIMSGSNTYISLPTMYGDMAGFGTSVLTVEERLDKVIHTRILPAGSYWIGQDQWGTVNQLYREFRMTVGNVYKRFGKDGHFSQHVQDMIDRHRWHDWVDVGHMVEPNDQYDQKRPQSKYKRFGSCWFELGCSSKQQKYDSEAFITEGGFDSFPYLVGRWKMTEGDVYGIDCPGMRTIGDIKSMQIGEKRFWQGAEKSVNPHWIGPSSLRGQDNGFLPGETTLIDEFENTRGLRPLHEINPGFLTPLIAKQQEVKEMIRRGFHYDLFRLFESLEDRDRTATEIAARQREKIEQIAPTAGHVQQDVLSPFSDRIFEIQVRQNRIPPAPPEIQGREMDTENTGILAQAQKAVKSNPVRELLAVILPLLEASPEVVDKVDFDQAIDEIATGLGCPAKVVHSDEVVAQIRAARAKAQQAQANMQMVEQGSKAVKNLAQSPVDQDSALSRVMNMLGAA